MLRVREVPARVFAREGEVVAAASGKAKIVRRNHKGRLLALAVLGAALGSGGIVLTASLVQAEDDAGIHAFFAQEAARKAAQAGVRNAAYTSTAPTRYAPQANAYAPANNGWRLPLMQVQPDGRLAHPPIELNPFRTAPNVITATRQTGSASAMSQGPIRAISGGAKAVAYATAIPTVPSTTPQKARRRAPDNGVVVRRSVRTSVRSLMRDSCVGPQTGRCARARDTAPELPRRIVRRRVDGPP